ncbi:MAG TPA: hypothetical protein DDW30_01140 [Clostridiales bacterium]|mgnify:CR=1 FL=1|nr:hypothetical protein [Clostridiales bacterium]
MKHRLIRGAIAGLLSVSLLTAAVGCGGPDSQGGGAPTAETNSTEAVLRIDLSEYRIIRPAEALPSYARLFTKFRVALKRRTGLDLVMAEDTEAEGERELLLGGTNRMQSEAALAELENGYAIRYMDGKIAINATSVTAMEMALEHFLEETEEGNTTMRLPIDYSVCLAQEDTDCLRGITVNAIGDSYLYGATLGTDKVWLSLLANELDMTVNNYGINGSTVSAYEDHHAMVNRFRNMRAGADLVIIEGGRNDYNVRAPLGELTGTDPKTYAGALNLMIAGIREQNPNALIVGITPWYVNSDMKRYSDMMLEVFRAQGLPCLNAADPDKVGVYMTDAAFRRQYCLNENDISHLNAEGMKLVLPVFRAFLAEAYAEYLSQRGG